MSEIRQIPDEFNEINPEDYLIIQRGNSPHETGKIKAENLNIGGSDTGHDTILTSISPIDYVLVEEALSPWRKGKVELQNLGVGGGSNVVSTYLDNVPPDPNVNTLNIGDKWIQYDGDIIINEWHYSRINGEYRWVGSLFNATLATNNSNDSLVIPVDYDLYVESFTSYLRVNSISPSDPNNYNLAFHLLFDSMTYSNHTFTTIAINDFQNPLAGQLYTSQVPIREIATSKYTQDFSNSDSVNRISSRYVVTNGGSSNVTSVSTATVALVFKEQW